METFVMKDQEIGFLKVKLTRLSSTRTKEVEGTCAKMGLPKVGKRFRMLAPSLESGLARLVETSMIVDVEKKSEGTYEFETLNSAYMLEVVGEAEPVEVLYGTD